MEFVIVDISELDATLLPPLIFLSEKIWFDFCPSLDEQFEVSGDSRALEALEEELEPLVSSTCVCRSRKFIRI